MKSRYGTDKQFIQAFNPDVQFKVVRDEVDCYFGDVPTLEQLNEAYMSNTAQQWLVGQLFNLSEFVGARDKLNDSQLEQLAEIIVIKYPFLRVTEMMLFFFNFKAGKYAEFYGTVDPLAITKSLGVFCRDRNVSKYKMERAFEESKLQAAKSKAITREEYCKMMGYDPETWNPLKRLADSFPSDDKPKQEDVARVLESARMMVENTDGLKKEHLDMMFRMFEKKHGMTPQDYISKHGEG